MIVSDCLRHVVARRFYTAVYFQCGPGGMSSNRFLKLASLDNLSTKPFAVSAEVEIYVHIPAGARGMPGDAVPRGLDWVPLAVSAANRGATPMDSPRATNERGARLSGSPNRTISATGRGWVEGPRKGMKSSGLDRMAVGAARSRLAME